jgi:hypothetical protein
MFIKINNNSTMDPPDSAATGDKMEDAVVDLSNRWLMKVIDTLEIQGVANLRREA